jgi:hypothetical protein
MGSAQVALCRQQEYNADRAASALSPTHARGGMAHLQRQARYHLRNIVIMVRTLD